MPFVVSPEVRSADGGWLDRPPAEASQELEALLGKARRGGDDATLAQGLLWLGRLLGLQGQELEAAQAIEEGREAARRLGDTNLLGHLEVSQAWIDADYGHHALALTSCKRVAEQARERGDDPLVRQALFVSATCLGYLGEHDLAVEMFEEARMMLLSRPGVFSEVERRIARGRYLTGQAQAWLMRGGLLLEAGGQGAAGDAIAKARALSEQACEALLGAMPRFSHPALFGLVRVMLEAGEVGTAREWVQRMAEAAPMEAPRGSLAFANWCLSEAMIELRAGCADPQGVLDLLAGVEGVPHPRVVNGDLRLSQLRCLFEAHERAGQYEQALACQQLWSETKARMRTRLAREHGQWTNNTLALWRSEAGDVVSSALREPLRQASKALAMSDGSSALGDAAQTSLRRAGHSVRRAIDIADQYLSVMRAEHMRQEDLQTLDVAALVDDVCEQMAPPQGASVSLVRHIQRPLMIRGDRVLLMRALGNLMSNAFKHAPPGSDVVVELSKSLSGALLSVSDAGPGLPLDMRARLFQRFATGAVRKGNGLGLAMVARAARVHQARIQVDCEVGQGTKVSLLVGEVEAGGVDDGL